MSLSKETMSNISILTIGHSPPTVQKAGQTALVTTQLGLSAPTEREWAWDVPHPQGAAFKSNMNSPVLYDVWLVIRTLNATMYFVKIQKSREDQTYLFRNTPLGRSVVSSAFMMTVPFSWTYTSPLANAVDLLTKLEFHKNHERFLNTMTRLTWHFRWNWNTTIVKWNREQGKSDSLWHTSLGPGH